MRPACIQSLLQRWPLAVALAVGIQLLVVGVGVAEEDHLKGYKIRDLNQVPGLTGVVVDNQFGSETCDLKKPQFFLVGSEKNGGDDPRGGPAGDFVCYKAKCTGALPPLTDADSQFGLHALETKKAKLVCLPVKPPCTGQLVGGFCWFASGVGASCDATCTGMGKTCSAGTVSYAGTGGSSSNCGAVLSALSVPGVFIGDYSSCGVDGYGCSSDGSIALRCAPTPLTTCSAGGGPVVRVCACE